MHSWNCNRVLLCLPCVDHEWRLFPRTTCHFISWGIGKTKQSSLPAAHLSLLIIFGMELTLVHGGSFHLAKTDLKAVASILTGGCHQDVGCYVVDGRGCALSP
jgi:hypothetical protein